MHNRDIGMHIYSQKAITLKGTIFTEVNDFFLQNQENCLIARPPR